MRIRTLSAACIAGMASLALIAGASISVQSWADLARDSNVAAGLVFGFVGLCGAGWYIEARILRPIFYLTQALDALSETTHSRRWAKNQVAELSNRYGLRDDEIGSLARALSRFQQHVIDLEALNRRFNAVLAHMPQGLCFYNNDSALVVSNRQYAELYRINPEGVRPGMSLQDVIEMRKRSGEDVLEDTADVRYAGDAAGHRIVRTRTGKYISVHVKEVPGAGWLATHLDITRRIRAEEKVAHLATHDALTGLANRTLFQREMTRALDSIAEGGCFALMCLDLDRFKQVNDALGHTYGDELLKHASDRIRSTLRADDVPARLGGDEFAIIIEGVNDRRALAAFAERIIKRISEPYALEEHHAIIGVSIGIAIAPHDGADSRKLLIAADMALYHAKSDGRGTYRFFEPEMDAEVQQRRSYETELRKALPNGEFALWYQPVLDLKEDRVTGCEALLRWNHPEKGLVLPDQFIMIAEESGQMAEIGAWVLREACAAAASWTQPLNVSVNLSPGQFRGERLVDDIASALARSGLSPDRLELEIAEGVMLENMEANLGKLLKLRTLGVRISFDNFGAGFSSLSTLRRFGFDKIKLHRSFIKDLARDDSSVAILRATLGLGAALSMETIAEGVETREQLDILRAEGCCEAQGYFIAPPAPQPRVERMLDAVARGKAA